MMNKLESILKHEIPKICLGSVGNRDGDISEFLSFIQNISDNQLKDMRSMLAKTRKKKLFISKIGFQYFPRKECFGLVNNEIEKRLKENIVIDKEYEKQKTVKYRRFLPKRFSDGIL